ncbi:MAG: hypothetical protein IJL44_06435 [Bacteroidales bacterium]|nr:hypothetical protein [Bacteroidales bacterium]
MKTYTANGKLLLTGEYLVLKGAVALALPTRLGQSFAVTDHSLSVSECALGVKPSSDSCHCEERSNVAIQYNPNLIRWSAHKPDGPWFSATLTPDTLEIVETDDPSKAEKLSHILKAVRELNPCAFQPGLHFETHLDFNPQWGLGSSSTLLSNLARWAEINPYQLLKLTIGGSGYDIACATANSAILYRLDNDQPLVKPIEFKPPFADHLFFVYQGKKQHSSDEVKAFNSHWKQDDLCMEIQTVSELSTALPTVTYFEDFCTLLQVHEDILSRCLNRPTLKTYYPDFEGCLKSLGAWGGDFLLAATPWPTETLKAYFHSKGLDTIFNYNELIV